MCAKFAGLSKCILGHFDDPPKMEKSEAISCHLDVCVKTGWSGSGRQDIHPEDPLQVAIVFPSKNRPKFMFCALAGSTACAAVVPLQAVPPPGHRAATVTSPGASGIGRYQSGTGPVVPHPCGVARHFMSAVLPPQYRGGTMHDSKCSWNGAVPTRYHSGTTARGEPTQEGRPGRYYRSSAGTTALDKSTQE